MYELSYRAAAANSNAKRFGRTHDLRSVILSAAVRQAERRISSADCLAMKVLSLISAVFMMTASSNIN